MVSEVWEYFVNQAFCQPSPDFDWASLQCWTPHLPLCFCLRHHHWRRPLFPPWSDLHNTLLSYFPISKAAATASGVWPEAGGPQGSLGESLKRWTRQPGIPLVSARWDFNVWIRWFWFIQERLWSSFRLQHHLLTGVADLPGAAGGDRNPRCCPYLTQERRWDIKVIFHSGSAWLNADGAATMISFPDPSMLPLVVGGIGYFRCLVSKLFTFTAAQGELW